MVAKKCLMSKHCFYSVYIKLSDIHTDNVLIILTHGVIMYCIPSTKVFDLYVADCNFTTEYCRKNSIPSSLLQLPSEQVAGSGLSASFISSHRADSLWLQRAARSNSTGLLDGVTMGTGSSPTSRKRSHEKGYKGNGKERRNRHPLVSSVLKGAAAYTIVRARLVCMPLQGCSEIAVLSRRLIMNKPCRML